MLKLLRLIKAVKESETLHLNSPILHHIFNGFVTIRVSASNSYISFDWQSRGDEFESRMLHVTDNIETIIANRLKISKLTR